jgi:hypothetical protein
VTQQSERSDTGKAREFAERASQRQTGIVREFWRFFRRERKWFLAPIVALLLVAGALVLLGGTSAAPLFYAIF